MKLVFLDADGKPLALALRDGGLLRFLAGLVTRLLRVLSKDADGAAPPPAH